ncbi:MAG: right-handed parallel beta-helix repeat-containing protein [Vicinamibacterales bacterium]
MVAIALGIAGAARGIHRTAEVVVGQGDDLQAAIDAAAPGDVIRLEPGAVFTGNYVLPDHGGDDFVTIRTNAPDSRLPGDDGRIDPSYARYLPTLRPAVEAPVLRTAAGAHHWRILGIRFAGTGGGNVVELGDGSAAQRDYAEIPEQLVLDRVIVLGDAARGQKRGVALNSGQAVVRNSYIAAIWGVGQETQAIAGWNGPGPYVIENNYLEAAGIGVLFGGAEPAIGGLVPSDITVRHNTVSRPVSWRDTERTVKNLFELKNARRVTVTGNLFERNWSSAQVGFAILFTVRSSGPRASWSVVEDVTFEHNVVRDVAGGINILGYDTVGRSQQTHGIVIRNNLFYDVDHTAWGGNGTFLQVGEAARDLTVEHNTVLQSGNLVTVYGGTRAAPRPVLGFRFTDNIGLHNTYGIFGNAVGSGTPAIAAYFPGGEIRGNVLAGGPEGKYPGGNLFPPVDELMRQFVNPAAHDYRLRPASGLLRSATDGGRVGADIDALESVQAGLWRQ